MSSERPRTKQEAHNGALENPLTDQFNTGQQLELIILESPGDNNGREAFARYNDVAVFVRPGQHSLTAGTHIKGKISEIGENHLKTLALAVIG